MEDDDIRATVEPIDDTERVRRQYAPLMIGKGVVALISGIVLLFWPKAGIAVVSVALGAFLAVDGIERLTDVLRNRRAADGGRDIWSILGALLRLVFGLLIMLRPVAVGGFWMSLVFIIAGLNLIAGSLLLLWQAPGIRGEVTAVGSAVVMLLLGLLMILLPLVTALFLLRLVGVLLVLGAVPSIAVGLRSR